MLRLGPFDLTEVMTNTMNATNMTNATKNDTQTTARATTLVIGGNGKTGRKVAEKLTAQGRPVRVGSRSGEPAFDWNEPGTWLPALEGVDRVYVTYYPDLAFPGAVEQVGAFAEAAVAAGHAASSCCPGGARRPRSSARRS